MEQNISTTAYVRGGRQLLYSIVEFSINEYVMARVTLEKHERGIKQYKEKTLEAAKRKVEENELFFKGEFMQEMYPSLTYERLIEKLEKQVEKKLLTDQHIGLTDRRRSSDAGLRRRKKKN